MSDDTKSDQAASSTVLVTPENFLRAESDKYFAAIAVTQGGFGKFEHRRELSPIAEQHVIRQNRDTLYSAAVFDLAAGTVSVTLPDAAGRFMSLQVIDEDGYCPGPTTAPNRSRSHARRSGHAMCSRPCAR